MTLRPVGLVELIGVDEEAVGMVDETRLLAHARDRLVRLLLRGIDPDRFAVLAAILLLVDVP
jgi:hypothetical protein